MNQSMEYWDKMSTPPDWAKKPIKGGRLNGMTSISPQWRYQVMTEQFGPCGIGWKYAITSQDIIAMDDGQQVVRVNINLYIKVADKWSEPIPGSGGSMFVAKESKGLYTSDEAFKMATTDALSVAMKMLGVGAAVYSGEDDKYGATRPQPEPTAAPKQDRKPIVAAMNEIMKDKEFFTDAERQAYKAALKAATDIEHLQDMLRNKQLTYKLRQLRKLLSDPVQGLTEAEVQSRMDGLGQVRDPAVLDEAIEKLRADAEADQMELY